MISFGLGADSTCLHKMDKEEEVIAKANQELEKTLKDVKPKAMEATEAALKVSTYFTFVEFA